MKYHPKKINEGIMIKSVFVFFSYASHINNASIEQKIDIENIINNINIIHTIFSIIYKFLDLLIIYIYNIV